MGIKRIKYELFKNKSFKDYSEKNRLQHEISVMVMVARIKARLTQEQLSKKAKLTQSSLGRLEAGNHFPNLKTLQKIVKALGKKLIIKIK